MDIIGAFTEIDPDCSRIGHSHSEDRDGFQGSTKG